MNHPSFPHRLQPLRHLIHRSFLIVSFCIVIPSPTWADTFFFDVSPFVSWITTSSLQIDHDAAGILTFTGSRTSSWTAINLTADTDLDGPLFYTSATFI